MERAGGKRFNSRNLPRTFVYRNSLCDQNEEKKLEEEQEVEFNLGLSLKGRFGLDSRTKRLKPSYSVSDLVGSIGNGSGKGDREGLVGQSQVPLLRAYSMPTETEEYRRRKEEVLLTSSEEARKLRKGKGKMKNVVKGKEPEISKELHGVVTGTRDCKKHETGIVQGSKGLNPKESSQGVVTSSASGGASGSSDRRSQAIKGTKQKGSSSKQTAHGRVNGEDELKNVLPDMPFVSAGGYGGNNPKIEGFLYKYRTGDDIKIVCVCHGLFLSPAEFVKHGGGGEVAHPLRHIMVSHFRYL